VTEAACKTVFTQRMKQSGMTWNWSFANSDSQPKNLAKQRTPT
jgi:hypothetical protein